MERALLSRQPICRPDLSVFAYELLFRDSDVNRANIRDNAEATAQVVVNTMMDLGLRQVVGSHRAFINVSSDFLLSEFCEILPSDSVVLELMEPLEMDATLAKRVQQLTGMGYQLAAGEFVFKTKFEPVLEAAHFIKFDMLGDLSLLKWHLERTAQYSMSLIAERVETLAQFEMCRSLGFDYFQGYVFCRPEFVQSKRLPLSRLTTLRLISKLNEPNLRIEELEEAIRRDLSLSYKLLKFVSSAGSPVRKEITSIRHAAVLTGIERLKIWASLILFSGIGESHKEVTTTAVIRARMCEKLAEALHLPNSDQSFLVGLFSVLDAMLGQSLAEIVQSMDLSPTVTHALLYEDGILGEILRCVKAYEQRAWSKVCCGNLDMAAIRDVYVKAMAWAIQTLTGFAEAGAATSPQSTDSQNQTRRPPLHATR